MGSNPGEQFLLDGFRLGERTASEHGLLVKDLFAYDLVDPRLVDVELAQLVGSGIALRPVRKKVGERCSIVTWPHSAAIAGINVAAVAPEPMTTTFFPA
jgi:hypothetical protein